MGSNLNGFKKNFKLNKTLLKQNRITSSLFNAHEFRWIWIWMNFWGAIAIVKRVTLISGWMKKTGKEMTSACCHCHCHSLTGNSRFIAWLLPTQILLYHVVLSYILCSSRIVWFNFQEGKLIGWFNIFLKLIFFIPFVGHKI